MKKLVIMVCVLVLVLGMGLYGVGKTDDQVAKKAKKAYEKAAGFLQKKEFIKAEEQYKQVIQIEPEWAMGYAGLGALKRQQNNLEEALPLYAKALDLRPELKNTALEYADVLNRQGMAAMNSKQLEKSNEYLLKILDIPSLGTYNKRFYLFTVYLVANNFSGMNQFEKALTYLTKLVRMSDGQADVADLYANGHYLSGISLSRLKKYDEANPYLQKYIELSKDNAGAAQFVTIAHYMLGINNYEVLIQKMEAIKNQPLAAERKAKADGLEQQKAKLGKGPAAVKKSAKLDEEILLIKSEDNREKKEKIAKLAQEAQVESHLVTAIQGMPNLEDAYVRLGNYYYLSRNLPKAIETYKSLIEKFPASSDLSAYKSLLQALEKENSEVKK